MTTKAERQEATIDRLRAELQAERRRRFAAEHGRKQLLVMLTTPEPPEADEWAEMVREASAEVEAEIG